MNPKDQPGTRPHYIEDTFKNSRRNPPTRPHYLADLFKTQPTQTAAEPEPDPIQGTEDSTAE